MACKAKGNVTAKPCAIPKGVSTEVPRYGTVAVLLVHSPIPYYYIYPPWPYRYIANSLNKIYYIDLSITYIKIS